MNLQMNNIFALNNNGTANYMRKNNNVCHDNISMNQIMNEYMINIMALFFNQCNNINNNTIDTNNNINNINNCNIINHINTTLNNDVNNNINDYNNNKLGKCSNFNINSNNNLVNYANPNFDYKNTINYNKDNRNFTSNSPKPSKTFLSPPNSRPQTIYFNTTSNKIFPFEFRNSDTVEDFLTKFLVSRKISNFPLDSLGKLGLRFEYEEEDLRGKLKEKCKMFDLKENKIIVASDLYDILSQCDGQFIIARLENSSQIPIKIENGMNINFLVCKMNEILKNFYGNGMKYVFNGRNLCQFFNVLLTQLEIEDRSVIFVTRDNSFGYGGN